MLKNESFLIYGMPDCFTVASTLALASIGVGTGGGGGAGGARPPNVGAIKGILTV